MENGPGLKMYLLWKMVIFHCHVSLLEGKSSEEPHVHGFKSFFGEHCHHYHIEDPWYIYPHLAPFFSWILWGLGAHGVSNDLPSLFVLRNHLHNVTFRQCYSGAPAPDKTVFSIVTLSCRWCQWTNNYSSHICGERGILQLILGRKKVQVKWPITLKHIEFKKGSTRWAPKSLQL